MNLQFERKRELTVYEKRYRKFKENGQKFTSVDYEERKIWQDNKCAICFTEDKKLGADHDHTTGIVRGLLCANCNSGIGFLKDDFKTLIAAARYLRKYRCYKSRW